MSKPDYFYEREKKMLALNLPNPDKEKVLRN